MPSQCDPCAESKIACRRMLGAGPDFPARSATRGSWSARGPPRTTSGCSLASRACCEQPLPPPVLRPRRASRAASNAVAGPSRRSCLPPVGKCRPTSRAAGYDVPFPANEREGYYAGLDPERAALFWRSELECSEAMIDVLYRQRDFHRQQLDEALMRCKVSPPDDGPRA
jgi:hypothetical protein